MESFKYFIVMNMMFLLPLFLASAHFANPDAEALKDFLYNDTFLEDVREILLPYIESSLNESSELVAPKNFIKCVKKFYLWTRDYRDGMEDEELDPRNITSIKSSHFKARKTYIIIHGFLGNGLEEWITGLRDKYLFMEDCNVISVDWPAGNAWIIISYITTIKKVRLVGSDVAFLMESLIKYKGMLLVDVHFIGHSLGAHAAGFASKVFKGRVGRITGLDPAGPYYHGLNSTRRLDKSDAVYVDIIHTNACNKWPYWTDCFGLDENIGHSDFWPNGGKHQPGCVLKIRGEIGCDHMIAHDYFIESLNYDSNTTLFLARPCPNWTQYIADNCSCGKQPQFMGFNINTLLTGVFYLWTNSESPYASIDWECGSAIIPWQMILLMTCGTLLIITMVSCLLCGCYFVKIFQLWCCKPCSPSLEAQEPLMDEEQQ